MLEQTRPELAAVLTCHAFEILMRQLGEKYGVSIIGSHTSLERIIDEVLNYGGVTPVRKALWRRFNDLRNSLFHEGRPPSDRERSQLNKEILRIERETKTPSGDDDGPPILRPRHTTPESNPESA